MYEEDVYNDGKKPDPRSKTRSCNHKIMMHCSPMSLAKTFFLLLSFRLWPKLNKYKFDAWLHKDISHMKFMAACVYNGDKKYSSEKYIWQNLTPFFKRMGNRWIFRRLVFAIGAGASLDNVTTRLWKRTDVILPFSTFRQRKLFLYFFHKSQHANIF